MKKGRKTGFYLFTKASQKAARTTIMTLNKFEIRVARISKKLAKKALASTLKFYKKSVRLSNKALASTLKSYKKAARLSAKYQARVAKRFALPRLMAPVAAILVLALLTPATVVYAAANYTISGNTPVISGTVVTLSGTASANPYTGPSSQQQMGVDWTGACNSSTATDFAFDSVTFVGGTGPGQNNGSFTNATWSTFHDYGTAGTYSACVKVYHQDFNGAEGSFSAIFTTSIVIPPPGNAAPVAVADAYSVDEDDTLSVSAPGVLTNDTDTDVGDTLTAVPDTDVSNGTLTLNADGSFDYTPTPGYDGPDSFTYHANDGTDDSNIVTVNITVDPVTPGNTAPTAGNLSIITEQNTATSSTVTGSDTDIGDILTYGVLTGPTNGSLTSFNGSTGEFAYDPTNGFSGADSFTFEANDGTASSSAATVSITVNAPGNNAPVATNLSVTTDQDTATSSAVIATDGDSDPLTYATSTNPVNGALVFDVDGTFTYTPNPGYSGSDSFTYIANDGSVNSNTATVSITVNAVVPGNTAPAAVADAYSVDEDDTLSVSAPGVLTNDTDADSDPLTAVLDTDVSNGTLTLNADGSFDYTPTPGYDGPDSFTYHANDGTDDSNIVTVSLTVNNITPSSGGGGGGGGGGSSGGQVLGASTGEVLGESCGLYMNQYLKMGSPKNDAGQVTRLQQFLVDNGFGSFTPTGNFGPQTHAAVKAFQARYAPDILAPWNISAPTGLAYLTTIRMVNMLQCPDLMLPVPTLIPWNLNPNAQ